MLSFIRSLPAMALAAFRLMKCPKCQSSRIAVFSVKRGVGQRDGFDGVVCNCKSCGHHWPITNNTPVI